MFGVDVLNRLFGVLINRSENNSCPFPRVRPLHFTFKITRRVFSPLNAQQGRSVRAPAERL